MVDFNVFHGLPVSVGILLTATAFFTSFMTASLGAGGGILMLGVMAQVLPPQAIIPIHGVVQLGSNAGRAALSRRHIDWSTILLFLPGVMLGGIVGYFLLISLPPKVMYLSIAGFILFLCWGPKLPKLAVGKMGLMIAGGISAFVGLFVGASGPLVGAFLKQLYATKLTTIATFACAMSLQHMVKLGVFGLAGFDLTDWLPLVFIMICSGALGTWFGLSVVKKVSDRHYHQIFNWILTLLALRLIWQAFII